MGVNVQREFRRGVTEELRDWFRVDAYCLPSFPSAVLPLSDITLSVCPFFHHLCSPFRFGNTNNYHRKARKSGKFLIISDIFQRLAFQQKAYSLFTAAQFLRFKSPISISYCSRTVKIM